MKQCSKCKRFLPETEFNFKNKKFNKRRNDCRDCRNAERRKKYWIDEAHRENIKKKDKEYYHRNIEKKRAYDRKRGKTLKRKLWYKQYNKKYYKEHKDEIAEQQKDYYLKNKGKKLERQRKYYLEHKKERNEYGKKHKHENRKYYREIDRRREIKKKNLFEDFTLEEWKQKLAETKGICPLCNTPFSEVYPFCATIDHTPPISKAPDGFHYTIDNITPMCGSCNSAKGNN